MLQSHSFKRSIPTAATGLKSVRFNSNNSNSSNSNSNSSSSPSSFNDPDFQDQILLDKLFRKNKPSRNFIYQNGSFLQRQEQSNLQQTDKFTWLDEKLLKLKSTPVNFNYYLRSIRDLKNANQLPYKFGSNQLMSNDPKMDQLLKKILWEFNAPIRYAFGYGSKVFSQGENVDVSNSQMDMIFAVSYPDHWHSLNTHQNPGHYSSVRHLGSNAIASIENLGAGVYFNPFVKMDFRKSKIDNAKNLELKYGVTSMDNLIDDLTNWRSMYISGRLHKPVAIIRNSPNISLLNQFNLTNAIKLSVLLLNKHQVKESELYLKIASLSYQGDPRLKVKGENPKKVENIVINQFQHFRELYLPLLQNYFPYLIQSAVSEGETSEHVFNINLDTLSKAQILVDLPREFRRKLFSKYENELSSELSKDLISQNVLGKLPKSVKLNPIKQSNELTFMELQQLSGSSPLTDVPIQDWEYLSNSIKIDDNEFIIKLANDSQLVNRLEKTIEDTVYRPALTQSLKGVLTAGITKSVKYAYEKRKKYNASTKN